MSSSVNKNKNKNKNTKITVLRYISDIHLEMIQYDIPRVEDVVAFLKELIPITAEDKDRILVLPGDIFTTNSTIMQGIAHQALQYFSTNFAHVVYVPGNHEFYGHTIKSGGDTIRAMLQQYPNIHDLNNMDKYPEGIVLKGVHFIGGTLWSDVLAEGKLVAKTITRSLSDYTQITGFNTAMNVAIHQNFVKILTKFTKRREGVPKNTPLCVVTHHLPSYKSIPFRFISSAVNAAFATELQELIIKLDPVVWLHGHTHGRCSYKIGNTEVRANPYGYSPEENPGFRTEALYPIQTSIGIEQLNPKDKGGVQPWHIYD